MRVYYHPSVGVYARYPSFEWDYCAAVAGFGGLGAGAGGYAVRKTSRGGLLGGLAGMLIGGIIGGAFVPKRILSWFNPPPFDAPLRYPSQIPKVVVPSFIGDAGQVLNLLMYEGAGDVVKDYSGFKNHGRIYGASWVDGPFGWALSFDGVDDYVEVADNPVLRGFRNFTVILWVNMFDKTDDDSYLWYDNPDSNYGWAFRVRYQNLQYFYGYGTYRTALNFDFSNRPVNKWYQVGFRHRGDDAKLDFIYNGNILATVNLPYLTAWRTGRPLQIGRCWRYGPPKLIGDLRIYNRALSDSEIKYHFESTRTIFGV